MPEAQFAIEEAVRRRIDAIVSGLVVDIGGVPELEARYREWLPVIEVDGERAFVYHVPADALRRRLAR